MESFHVIHTERAKIHGSCLKNVENRVESTQHGLHKNEQKQIRGKRLCITHPQYAQWEKSSKINTSACG